MGKGLGRRDFLKLGIAGGGLALAGELTSPFASATEGNLDSCNHPWWVKELDKPILSIDDSVYKQFDSKANVFGSLVKYVGIKRLREVRKIGKERTESYYRDNRPGFRLEDRALSDASWTVSHTGGLNKGLRSWKKKFVTTPKQRGIERYSGSPQEAANLVKKAARFFGAATTGITLLDRRHIYSRDGSRDIVFEDVKKPKKGRNKLVIPDKCKYAIALSIRMPFDNLQCAPTAIAGAAASLGYSRCEFLVGSLAEFIRGLGYNAIPSVNDLGSSVAIAVDAGLGELGRTNRLITPEFGATVRLAKVITDLPMAVDKPISFGLLEFCKVCKRCAEACPPGVLSFNDEPDFKVRGEWNNPGHQTWFEDAPKCLAYWQETTVGCSICLGVCPWSKMDKTILHSIVKASSSKMPFLDGIFTSMDKTFGYGRQKDAEKWWELDLPEYGIDTPRGKG